MTLRRAQSFVSIVDDNNEVVSPPSGSPAGTPADSLLTVQGATVGYPIAVVGRGDNIDVILTADTSQYANNDVLADTQEIANAVRENGGRALLHSLVVIDESDQGQDIDFVFLSANQSIGTENSAVSITDQSARDILGIVSVATTDYSDLINSQVATLSTVGLQLKAAEDTTSLWIAAIVRSGTPTYAANGIRLKLGLLWD